MYFDWMWHKEEKKCSKNAMCYFLCQFCIISVFDFLGYDFLAFFLFYFVLWNFFCLIKTHVSHSTLPVLSPPFHCDCFVPALINLTFFLVYTCPCVPLSLCQFAVLHKCLCPCVFLVLPNVFWILNNLWIVDFAFAPCPLIISLYLDWCLVLLLPVFQCKSLYI